MKLSMARRMRWTFSSVSAEPTTSASDAATMAISSPSISVVAAVLTATAEDAAAPPPALPWLAVSASSLLCPKTLDRIKTTSQ